MSSELSADELALYDRQLRVWGAEGQNRIKNASVLLINFNGVGTEIVKNLVLSGIGSLEIWDQAKVKESDFNSQFFLTEEDLNEIKLNNNVKHRISDMNPRVKISVNTNELEFDDAEYFKNFNLVIANEIDYGQIIQLNRTTRALNIALYITQVHGVFGFVFSDLILDVSKYTEIKNPIGRSIGKISSNQEIIEVKKFFDQESEKVKETFTLKSTYKQFEEIYQSENLKSLTRRNKKRVNPLLSIFLAYIQSGLTSVEELKIKTNEVQSSFGLNEIEDLKYFEKFINQLKIEISPVTAIIGGSVAQDIINFLSKKVAPFNNVFILDGEEYVMPIYEL
ncbi:hypothetical protein WICMUC_004127 [Wickerhamomyces mucosus]|uniref:THIF-type NAD/FAD binding fold domain-containing protein n=1 Tax=Wickerhamomyces mucosus TaxID=1378264 RepID=A0A9P8TB80_9ASCO|nr:hypothetical protein WICMUC_004127 [Wickerhamomyces mucosus]